MQGGAILSVSRGGIRGSTIGKTRSHCPKAFCRVQEWGSESRGFFLPMRSRAKGIRKSRDWGFFGGGSLRLVLIWMESEGLVAVCLDKKRVDYSPREVDRRLLLWVTKHRYKKIRGNIFFGDHWFISAKSCWPELSAFCTR